MRNRKAFLSMLSLAVITIAMPIACSPSAQFTVDSLAVKPAEIIAGETASISAQITNTGGAEGFYRAVLSVDDERIDCIEEAGEGEGNQGGGYRGIAGR